jgi:tetratricopeptide (TPR) repeat protein
MNGKEHLKNNAVSKEIIQKRLSRCELSLARSEGQPVEASKIADLWRQRSYYLACLKRYPEAISSYQRTIALLPEDAKVWCNYGSALATEGHLRQAVEAYDHALALCPDYATVWRRRGRVLHCLKEHVLAIESYDQALTHCPTDSRSWHGQGLANLSLKRVEKAIECFQAAIAADPQLLDPRLALTHILIEQERYREAMSGVQPLVTQGRQDAHLFDCYAYLLDQRGDSDMALQYLEDAAYLQPGKAIFWFHRGLILTRLHQYPEAHDAFREALRRQADHADSWLALGIILRKLSEPEAAIAALDKALALSPGHPLAFFHQACCYALLGRHDWASEHLNRAISLDAETYLEKARRETVLAAL